MAETTTLKLPEKLKARIARLAKQTRQSPHSYMLLALEREVSREERMRDFVKAAMASDAATEAGGEVYRAEDVHAWMERLAKGEKPPRPAPWRK
jgi:predicted transcriptional regulator